jgi:hypothetical protein
LLFVQQVIFITVTGDTKLKRIFSPEIMAIIPAMRIVTKGASPGNQRSMDILTGPPHRLGIMAGNADVLSFSRGKPDPPWLNRLLMTSEAELAAHGAVLPDSI